MVTVPPLALIVIGLSMRMRSLYEPGVIYTPLPTRTAKSALPTVRKGLANVPASTPPNVARTYTGSVGRRNMETKPKAESKRPYVETFVPEHVGVDPHDSAPRMRWALS